MKLAVRKKCDVLILGSGIAGLSAALSASAAGASVILACKGKLFSGSSFYPGTWGLGLIGPADEQDEEDLIKTIRDVGCGMADETMVKTFVEGIQPAIENVRRLGVKLRKADKGAQKEYIPCFDHKHRDWNGLEFDSVRQVYTRELEKSGAEILSGWEAIELVKAEGRVCGAVISNGKQLQYIGSKAVVLATGGYGSLYKNHLCTSDVEGLGQALALEAGCRLINMEFMQIMPGYLSPARQTVFNEKTFRFTKLESESGEPLLKEKAEELLDVRSGHGPFTARLASREVDLAIDRECLQNPGGVKVTYSDEMKQNPPEFVKTYFDWLKETKHLTPDDPVYIGLFAHAANGGVWIDPNAGTGVPGLFAAGETTGGMHGADRIGGLSTANGLVFGLKAGRSAAEYAKADRQACPSEWQIDAVGTTNADEIFKALQSLMTSCNMVNRTEEGLTRGLAQLEELKSKLVEQNTEDAAQITLLARIKGQLLTAESILTASCMRKESRGSHYRADHPGSSDEYNKNIVISRCDGKIAAEFREQISLL